MDFLTLGIIGLAVGLVSTIMGIGGGIIIVPTLYTLFPQLPHQTIISTSLTVIFFNSIINVFYFKKLNETPHTKLMLIILGGLILGIWQGASLTSYVTKEQAKFGLGILIIISILKSVLSKKSSTKQAPNIDELLTFKIGAITFLFSAVGGLVAGFTGLGGGIVVVPLLLTLFKFPPSLIPVYSNPGMAGATLVGSMKYLSAPTIQLFTNPGLQDYQVGYVNFSLVGILVLASAISAKFGASLKNKLPEKGTKVVFNALLLFFVYKLLSPLFLS